MERQDNAILGEQSPDQIAELRTAADQAAADAVQRLQVLLDDRLLGNKPHLGPADRLTNRCRVPGVVLLTLQIRLHELRCNPIEPRGTNAPITRAQ